MDRDGNGTRIASGRRPVLVTMTGLPATGKSAIAEAVAAFLRCPTYSVDPLEAVLLRGGITREERSDYIAYDLAAYCAEGQLRRGQSAVVDAVNALASLQGWWADMAKRHDAAFRLIHTVCSDPGLHRSRLEGRKRNLEGFCYEPTWEQVQSRRYETPTLVHLALDAVGDLETNVGRAIAYVDGSAF